MIEHITNPLEYIECIIAFDPLDWSADSRHATVYAIVLGWSDEAYTELQNKFNWNDEAVKRLKKFHEEWERMRDARKLIRCKDGRGRAEGDGMKEYIVEYETKQLGNGKVFYGGKISRQLIRCWQCKHYMLSNQRLTGIRGKCCQRFGSIDGVTWETTPLDFCSRAEPKEKITCQD